MLSRYFSRVAAFLTLAAISAWQPIRASAAQGEVVQMAPMRVKESKGQFDFDVRADEKTMRVQEVRIAWVSDWAHKKGLRVGDHLTAIDGKPIGDFVVEALASLMQRDLKAGETLKLQFTGSRFGFPRKITLTSRG